MQQRFLTTREVADFLKVNEKQVYALVADKGLPASKVTGKWIFPRHLVEQWVEAHTENYPPARAQLPPYEGLLIIAGSNDLLLDKAIALFNTRYPEQIAVFGNLGSMGGLQALRNNRCHIASSHLLQENDGDYNFEYLAGAFSAPPAVVAFCRRQQGLLLGQGNPLGIDAVAGLAQPGVRIVNRALGTGTRLLFDRELKQAGINGQRLTGYERVVHRHMDVGLEILSGRADAGPGIQPVADLLGLAFLPLRWERYDLLISKERFFDRGVQLFQGLLHDAEFRALANDYSGYDLENSGRMVYPQGHD